MVKTKKGESLDVALKRLDEAANLSDIDLTKFVKVDSDKNKSGDKKKPKDLEVKVVEGEKPAKNESKKNSSEKEDSVKNNK
jgi:hypothetical protein